ncbi:uncharacterized protein TM35_000016980 [Trypanosoma theileri]|uniref:Uncharacterized protein n=1 Tax=Trypanosoma theileri TaxID=67003 RepID=A0A1X0PAG8_9TRYP|nr:uncharacterized protein TM35_000016980 [Trypanosoma theileri]ORC93821.1 hypothetical protein TM35_000016980 [Trypanosoma theileri]
MAQVLGAVKQRLCASQKTRSVDVLLEAYEVLQRYESGTMFSALSESYVPIELYILCCETAIELGKWDIAKKCLKTFSDKRTPTKALESRALYCDALVALHNIPSSCRGKAKISAHLQCASKIVTGIKIVLEEWPKEAHTLTIGVEHLWLSIRDLFNTGTYESVVDIIVFVVALHEKLLLGGPFSHLQWILRYAVSLRGLGRFQEAVAQLTTASDVISKVGSERLQLQLFRFQIPFSANLPGFRPKQDYTKPVMQGIYAVQSFFCGITDEHVSRMELIAAHERLITDPEKKEVKPKGKKNVESEFTFNDPALVMDVLSEVVLGLALCGADETCSVSLSKVLQSESVRPRLFGEYAQAILKARACGALDATKALDASYLTRSTAEALFKCIKTVEGTMDSARMIEDPSERSYTLEIGCVILWNLCLPLLQPETRGRLRHTLKRISLLLANHGSNLTRLLVHVAYESSLVEFEEDNLTTAIEQVDRALSLDYFVVNTDGNIVFPMDFALQWLKRRCLVRRAIDTSALSSQEDQVIHLIEQARTTASTSNRLVLLHSAVNKLPPLNTMVNITSAIKEKTPVQREQTKSSKQRKQATVIDTPEEPTTRLVTNPSVANIYYLLLKEAKEIKSSSINQIIETVAESLTHINILKESDSKNLLVMQAEAHLSMAEVLLTKSETNSNTGKTNSTDDAMSHISEAAKISVKLCAAGYHEEWIVVNACLSLINWFTDSFRKGLFLSAATVLGELYMALNQTRVDPIREYKLFDDIGFGYVMSIIQMYISSKGEVNGELSCETLEETMEKTFLYPICEANNPILRKALDIIREIKSKWSLPSRRKKFTLLDSCVHRLFEKNQDESHHPQELLLFSLGRLSGPISSEEKRHLINKECLDLLRLDPSVELCGRLATHSMQIPENERVTLELCRIADHLYQNGKLGWGTKMIINPTPSKEKGDKGHSSSNVSSTSGSISCSITYPKPCEDDWYWYAVLLLYQATVLLRLGSGIERSKRLDLEKRILVVITNSAIAASHGPPRTQISQISQAYHAFCIVADSFSGASRHLLFPSLKMLLSPSIVTKLKLSSRAGGNDGYADREGIYTLLTTMAGYFLTALLEKGAYDEGIKIMNELLSVLPPKYHRVFHTFEAQFRCNLGLSMSQLLHKIKGGDPETEAAVWIAIAKSAGNITESTKAWVKSVEILSEKPLEKADTLLQMSEWMTAHNAISRHELVTLLLSALDAVEHFGEIQMIKTLSGSTLTSSLRSVRQTLASSLGGRTFALSHAFSTRSYGNTSGGTHEPPSLRDAMTAIRILYFLFVIAPEESSNDGSFTDSKISCTSTIIYYIFCLWQIVSIRVRVHDENLEHETKNKPLELPEEFYGWQGFRVDPHWVDVIRSSCPDDATYNTVKLWGMLMEVCEFFMRENMEQYAFIIFSWIEFSVSWRYGNSDPRALAIIRAVYYKSFMAASRCGLGRMSNMYHVDEPKAEYWSSIQEILLTVEPPLPFSDFSDGFFSFTSCKGTIYHSVLVEAEELFSLGRIQESLEWNRKVLQCAMRVCSNDTIIRCHLLEARASILRGEGAYAAEQLSLLEENYSKLTFQLWTELRLIHFEALVSCQKLEEAINLVKQIPISLSLRANEINTDCVAKDVVKDILRDCQRRVLRESAQLLVSLFDLPFHRFCWPGKSEYTTKTFLSEVCDQLREFGDWKSRSIALRVRQNLRPCVDETLLVVDIDKGKEILTMLYEEYCELLEVTELVRQEMEAMIPVSSYTQSIAAQPGLAIGFDEVLVMRARNCLERELLKDFILLRYHQLTMEQLGIPTGGPKELESSVLQYMRDPKQYEYIKKSVQEEEEDNISGTAKNEYDPEKELECALNHFGIPVAYMEGASGVDAEAMLWRVTNSGEGCSPIQMEAFIRVSLAEFQRRLKAFSKKEDSSTINDGETVELGSHYNNILTKKWTVPIVVAERALGRKYSRKVLQTERRKGKKIIPVETTETVPQPINLWINESSNLIPAIKQGITYASHLLDYKELAKCYICLAHSLILSDMPYAAGTAIEFAQAAEMYSFIVNVHGALLSSSPESNFIRLVEKMKRNTPFLLNTTAFDKIRTELMTASSMYRRCDLVGHWPREPNNPDPLPPDYCTFSVVREGCTPYFLVALRRPDGMVDSRRVQLDVNALLGCGDAFKRAEELQRGVLVRRPSASSAPPPSDGSFAAGVRAASPPTAPLLRRLEVLTAPLWEDFRPALASLAPGCHLFLCLDPLLHALPLEMLSPIIGFASVQRELSVLNVRQKFAARSGKTQSGSTLLLIDPFAEHEGALQTLVGPENRHKSTSNEIITATKESNGTLCKPSLAYMQRSLASNNHSSVLVNTCGAFTDIVTPQSLAELSLDHLQVVFYTEGTNERSLRRRQKQQTSKTTLNLLHEKQSIFSLLFLARGVQYLCGNAFPLSPEECDALSKRCLPVVTNGGKGVYEAVRAAAGEIITSVSTDITPSFIFYGVPISGKQK